MTRHKVAFGALVLTQAAHSVEEYVGRLWETFPPARFMTELVSEDQKLGFLLLNVALVAFGVWCFLWPIRRDWPSAVLLAWIWVPATRRVPRRRRSDGHHGWPLKWSTELAIRSGLFAWAAIHPASPRRQCCWSLPCT